MADRRKEIQGVKPTFSAVALPLTSASIAYALGYTPTNAAAPAASSTFTATAGEALGGNRVVYIAGDGKAYHANPDATSLLVSGLSKGAAALGAVVTIQLEGIFTEPTWTWSAAPVFLSTTGLLTQTVPTSGYCFQVGTPVGPTSIRIEPRLIARIT